MIINYNSEKNEWYLENDGIIISEDTLEEMIEQYAIACIARTETD